MEYRYICFVNFINKFPDNIHHFCKIFLINLQKNLKNNRLNKGEYARKKLGTFCANICAI
jgi:hypothetical protein